MSPAEYAAIKPKVVDLTPAIAEELLGRNTHNRDVRHSHVKKLAGAMKRGEWMFNGEAIKIDTNDKILDGQHRLLAVIEADVTITVLIIEGLAPDTQSTMDGNKVRNLGDTLKLAGEVQIGTLAAAIKTLYYFEKTGVPYASGPGLTVAEGVELLKRHPGLRDSVGYAANNKKYHANRMINKSHVAAFHYIFTEARSQQDAEDFFGKIGTGENLVVGDPIHTLRERLLADQQSVSGKLRPVQRLAFIVRTWNGYQDGEKFTRLLWRAGGSSPDRFPRVRGWEIDTDKTVANDLDDA